MGDSGGGWKTGKVIAAYMRACGHAGPSGMKEVWERFMPQNKTKPRREVGTETHATYGGRPGGLG